jgi:flagellar biosynthesis protein FlhG
MAQRPLVEVFPHSPATRALNQIADRLFRSPPPEHAGGGLKLMWRRLQREANT